MAHINPSPVPNGTYGQPRRYRSQRWYTESGPVTSYLLVQGKGYFVPLDVDLATTFDRIGANVSGAGTAGSVIRLGVYADDGTGAGPTGAPLVDAGTIDGTSVTPQAIVISLTLQPGRYWKTAVPQGAPATTASLFAATGYNDERIGMFAQADRFATCLATNSASIAGALPSNPAVVTDDLGPLIFMRAL